jgi:hypothetical protein
MLICHHQASPRSRRHDARDHVAWSTSLLAGTSAFATVTRGAGGLVVFSVVAAKRFWISV